MPSDPLGFDFETCLIRPGLQAPPPVCATTSDGAFLVSESPTFASDVRALIRDRTLVVQNGAQFDYLVALAWLDCTQEVFQAIEDGRLIDPMWVERLGIIRRLSKCNPYALKLTDICRAHDVCPPTKDETQTSYEPLWRRPIEEYTDRQIEYALEDPQAHLAVWQRQKRWFDRGDIAYADLAMVVRKQFSLALTRSWGLRTDPERTDQLCTAVHEHVEALREAAQELVVDTEDECWSEVSSEKVKGYLNKQGPRHGRFRPVLRSDGTKDAFALQLLVWRAYDGHPPQTRAARNRASAKEFVPSIKADRATLEDSGDPTLETFAAYGEWSAVQNKDLDILLSGIEYPIHTIFGMADTTRATSSKPNIQNQRRDKPGRPSVRECFVARPGHVLIAIDHCGLELSTLAQSCVTLLKRHHMADRINAGEDLHSHVGAEILRTTYQDFRNQLMLVGDTPIRAISDADFQAFVDGTSLCAKSGAQILLSSERRQELWRAWTGIEGGRGDPPSLEELVRAAAKNARNNGKVVNFGCPGGMAWRTLKIYAKQNYGISLTDERAQYLVQLWRKTNPDGVAFLEYVHRLDNGHGRFDVRIPGTQIVRKNCTYCAACNTHFQGLGAVLEGHIAWLFARESHLGVTPEGRPSPMRWARPWNFVHDEHIFEVLTEARTEVYYRMVAVMREGASQYMPDVCCESEAICMARWSKRAKSKIVNGELTIWDAEI
jgi:hypothetical protein